MIITVPVENNTINCNVATVFGRAPYFAVYNKEESKFEFVENMAAKSQGGAGIKAAQILVDLKADVLITPRCGTNAADVLKFADVKVLKSVSGSLKNNIDLFVKGNLKTLSEIHSGFHNHGMQE